MFLLLAVFGGSIHDRMRKHYLQQEPQIETPIPDVLLAVKKKTFIAETALIASAADRLIAVEQGGIYSKACNSS